MKIIKNKKITVVGLGEKTGVSLVRYLSKGGAKIFVTEMKNKEKLLATWNQVSQIEAEFEFGGHSIDKVAGSDLAILCPGVPIDSPFVKEISKSGIDVVSELEFAWENLSGGKVIAVTGTNGKSTTVSMIGDILKKWGKRVFVGGNLGTPLIESLLSDEKFDFYVVEVSTFQLEGCRRFRPDIGTLLNISLNHLDRHKDMDEYAGLKLKIFENQKTCDVSVLNFDDPYSRKMGEKICSKTLHFSIENSGADIFFKSERIKGGIFGVKVDLGLSGFPLIGEHNISNFLASICSTVPIGCPVPVIAEAMIGFKSLSHRIEHVRDFKGVKYYDDSKSTTVDSTIKAIDSFEGNLILIAGGKDKGSDFGLLKGILGAKVKRVVLYGEAMEKMEKQLLGAVSIIKARSFDEAVFLARDSASAGDIVLLSPANASFDLFSSYKERGDRFKRIVLEF